MVCVSDSKTDIMQRHQDLAKVLACLEQLNIKRREFLALSHLDKENNNLRDSIMYARAADGANTIHQALSSLCKEYIQKEMELTEFKNKAKNTLQDNNPNVLELKKHRGIKELVVNILLAIAGLGFIYGIAMAITGRFLVFKPATNAGNIADKLTDLIKQVP